MQRFFAALRMTDILEPALHDKENRYLHELRS